MKPLEAAVGNFDFVESINFKEPVVRAPTVPADERDQKKKKRFLFF